MLQIHVPAADPAERVRCREQLSRVSVSLEAFHWLSRFRSEHGRNSNACGRDGNGRVACMFLGRLGNASVACALQPTCLEEALQVLTRLVSRANGALQVQVDPHGLRLRIAGGLVTGLREVLEAARVPLRLWEARRAEASTARPRSVRYLPIRSRAPNLASC